MPRTTRKAISFPLAGVSRSRGYRDQAKPYSAPWAINVRGKGSLETRERGGSRPGLAKVSTTQLSNITALIPLTGVDSDGDRYHKIGIIANGGFYCLDGVTVNQEGATLQTSDGTAIVTDNGTEIVFASSVAASSSITSTGAYVAAERNGKLLLADSVLRVFDPITGIVEDVEAESGAVPTSQPLVCLYRDRVVLSGADHLWYASRQSSITDWSFGDDMGDPGRAVAGQLSISGRIGSVPKALIPVRDTVLVFACENELWILQGDPATGQMEFVSDRIGIVSHNAWAKSPDGLIAFLSNDGVYLWGAGSEKHPTRFSMERLPKRLQDVDATANYITMVYDSVDRGFHLFVVPTDGTNGTHWWIDVERKALWPTVLTNDHQPTGATSILNDGLAENLLGCKDGYLRKFSRGATSDDGKDLVSHALLGPFRLSTTDVTDAMLVEIHGILAQAAGSVTWRVCIGDSAESVTDTAVAGVEDSLAGNTISGVAASGSWGSGRNKVERTRRRGSWCVIWLSSSAQWSYETITVVARQLGRLR